MCLNNQLDVIVKSQLMLVDKPHLVERYNNALAALTGKRTTLTSFHIDTCGYSPEIAEEMEDDSFLNPNGVNRQFIIIDVAQVNLRSISLCFSSTPFVIKRFINDNKKELLALTALDSVYGEIENNLIRVTCLADILGITDLNVICDTPKKIINTNRQIAKQVEDLNNACDMTFLRTEELSKLVEICKKTPSIAYDCYLPKHCNYKKNSVYVAHYGGFYRIGITDNKICIIYVNEKEFPLDQVPKGVECIHIEDIDKVVGFLVSNRILIDRDGSELQGIRADLSSVRQRIVIDYLASHQGINHEAADDYLINQFIRDNTDDLPAEFHEISRLISGLTRSERLDVKGKYILYTHKVNPSMGEGTEASYLINHLISNYMAYSYNKLFVYNLDRFKALYADWSDTKKAFVLSTLKG
ncbi:DUF6638 family protein [Vibrio splendidus]|nr:DUF6638 family protein [Vibrio splendidus]MCC4880386.1 hypothetical protein [Vibrio splendidus]